jgi:hypothetical protein
LRLAGYLIDCSADDSLGPGRWTTFLLWGKESTNLTILTAYQVCTVNIIRRKAKTVLRRQWTLLRASGRCTAILITEPGKDFSTISIYWTLNFRTKNMRSFFYLTQMLRLATLSVPIPACLLLVPPSSPSVEPRHDCPALRPLFALLESF